MKKILIIMMVLLLTGCQREFKKDFFHPDDDSSDISVVTPGDDSQVQNTQTQDPQIQSDLSAYYGTYYQDEITYVNENDYVKKADYDIPSLVYKINESSMTFESDLIYDQVSYQTAEINEDDRTIIPGITQKYAVLSDGKTIGVTLMMDGNALYIANDALVHDGYTYVAKMISKQDKEAREQEEKSQETNENAQ